LHQPCVSRPSLHLSKYALTPRDVPTIWLMSASLGLMIVPRTHCAKIPTAATRANAFLALSAQARCVQILMNVVKAQSSADRRRCASTPSAPISASATSDSILLRLVCAPHARTVSPAQLLVLSLLQSALHVPPGFMETLPLWEALAVFLAHTERPHPLEA